MIGEIVGHFLLETLIYPVLYGLGFLVLKGLSLGRARLLPLTDSDYRAEMRWYQLHVRRSGVCFWVPEATILVGAIALAAVAAAISLL